ncbi:hypothetical protein BD560DRAFT_491425 [Blakeslea trispora]|nr:hypothetical protein BD560DRAFT_491425 [Blakeslea trispora]
MEVYPSLSDHVFNVRSNPRPYIVLFFLQVTGWLFLQLAFQLLMNKRKKKAQCSNKLGYTNQSVPPYQKLKLQIQGNSIRTKLKTSASVAACPSDAIAKKHVLYRHQLKKGNLQDIPMYQDNYTFSSVSRNNLLFRVKRLGVRQRELLKRIQQSHKNTLLQNVDSRDISILQARHGYSSKAKRASRANYKSKTEPPKDLPSIGTSPVLSEWDPLSQLPSVQPLSGLPEMQSGNN